MNDKESLDIQNKLDKKINQLQNIKEKEENIKLGLLLSVFTLILVLTCFSTYLMYKSYKNHKNINNNTKILNINVLETEEEDKDGH